MLDFWGVHLVDFLMVTVGKCTIHEPHRATIFQCFGCVVSGSHHQEGTCEPTHSHVCGKACCHFAEVAGAETSLLVEV